ncbi:MAG: hypothetical protein LQ340_006151, partial [Diploschistes diacapsis]
MEGDVEGVMDRPGGYPDPNTTMATATTTPAHPADPADPAAVPSAAAPSGSGELLSREERAEQEKWDAWAACAGLRRAAAKCRYVDTLIETMRTYAYGTAEARELVDELEFVWEQVRGNTA